MQPEGYVPGRSLGHYLVQMLKILHDLECRVQGARCQGSRTRIQGFAANSLEFALY